MANRRSRLDDATARWPGVVAALTDELREARMAAGLTQRELARAVGVSRGHVSRVETRRARDVTLLRLTRHAAALGLRASIKLYPVGGAIRDEAQARYVARLVARVGRAWRVVLEAAVPIPGDLRAVDILLDNGTCRVAVEVITRLRDVQAQLRAADQKRRDIGAQRLVIVVAATHANRRAVNEARPALAAALDLESQRVLAALQAGRDPGRDALVLLR
jgi:transcriptional regulator with XRE-family HTH domain